MGFLPPRPGFSLRGEVNLAWATRLVYNYDRIVSLTTSHGTARDNVPMAWTLERAKLVRGLLRDAQRQLPRLALQYADEFRLRMDVFDRTLRNAPAYPYPPPTALEHHSIVQPALLAIYQSSFRGQGSCSCLTSC